MKQLNPSLNHPRLSAFICGQILKKICFILALIISLTLISYPSLADSSRSNIIIDTIQNKNKTLFQTDPNLLTYKYCKMAESDSPFPFYRATNYLFWQDLAKNNQLKQFGNNKTKIWLSGDLHVDNFGVFNNDLDEIVFDINDFDESIIGDYQYDIWRMATSIVLVARDNQLSPKDQETLVDAFTESYLDTLAAYRGNDDELKTYFTQNNTEGEIKKILKKAKELTRQDLLDKWVDSQENPVGFKLIEGKIEKADQEEEIKKAIEAYSQTLSNKLNSNPNYFQVKSVVKRVGAGLGSLGVPRYYVLIEGKSKAEDDDIILDVKLQSKPTAYEYLSLEDQENYDSHFKQDAERHAVAYRALTKHTDDYLGGMKLSDGYYSVRELSPYKKSLNTEKLNDQSSFAEVAEQWGKILATDHASADKDFDPVFVAYSLDKQVDELTKGHHQEFRELVKEVAFEYADQVKQDYDIFVKELKPKNCPVE
ncbi:conserved hypothetical protein [Gloeothece citriformis PCC 7424]|uniref:DUF2252 domain-containing protein n=1 Tax=Gloeothece citriformis (strain PCC 7424) TaxID=65393 RepID=B7KDP6_GLOC7|nr:DUF2252 domain-containing protein [Gloeothece citriformis]ACK70348.1 conserved hypothetical protein [Gloeothece citriformis PCC 7424]